RPLAPCRAGDRGDGLRRCEARSPRDGWRRSSHTHATTAHLPVMIEYFLGRIETILCPNLVIRRFCHGTVSAQSTCMGTIEEALTGVAEAIRAKGGVPEDVIIGLEQLRGSVGRWLSATGAKLYVPAHCRWFVSPSGVHVDLGRRPTMRRIVTALVEARIERP